MYCAQCGYNNTPHAEYCLNCDLDLRDESSGPAQRNSVVVFYAGLRARCLAAFLDILLLLALLIVGVITIAVVIAYSGRDHILQNSAFISVSLTAMVVVCIGYFVLMESGSRGTTFGQRCMNIMVLDSSYNQLSSSRSLLLLCARIFSHMTLNIGFLMRPFNPRKQALHDFISGTIVVRQNDIHKIPLSATLLVLFHAAMVPALAMFATAGLPVYQQHIQKVQIENGIKKGKQAAFAVARFYHNNGRVPAAISDVIKAGTSPHVAAIDINQQNGELTLTFNDQVRKAISRKHLIFTPAIDADKNIVWKCRSDDIEARLLPPTCR